jgi:SAM-dependent methyltransferase
MENEQTSIHNFDLNLICELHIGLERQGPGSPEMTVKALSFLGNLNKISRVADLGCGTGGQTMVLAQNITGNITGIDFYPGFIKIFNENIQKVKLQDRINGIVGEMENLPFQKGEFDLIWSEGAIANIGFEKGLNYWKDFLKTDGYIAVTYESWFTDKRPAEIEKWWKDVVPEISTIAHNILIMQKSGYIPVASFTLPEKCWTDNYFIPREAAGKALLEKYTGNKTIEALISNMKEEAELYSKYKQFYGYVFYIGKKI